MNIKRNLWRTHNSLRMTRVLTYIFAFPGDVDYKEGVPYVMHSCENVLPLVEDFIEIGLDALESLQPDAMNGYALKKSQRKSLS